MAQRKRNGCAENVEIFTQIIDAKDELVYLNKNTFKNRFKNISEEEEGEFLKFFLPFFPSSVLKARKNFT